MKDENAPEKTARLPASPRVEIDTVDALRQWLAKHHDSAAGVWVITFKKAAGARHIPYADVRDEALCWGWIDSRPAKVDGLRSALLLSPRRAGSGWSAINKRRVADLIAEGRMAAAGLKAVERAKSDGSWTRLDAASALTEPPDLARTLRGNRAAAGHWEAFPPSARRAILEWIGSAKTPETRARRISETVRLAAMNLRANTAAARGK